MDASLDVNFPSSSVHSSTKTLGNFIFLGMFLILTLHLIDYTKFQLNGDEGVQLIPGAGPGWGWEEGGWRLV